MVLDEEMGGEVAEAEEDKDMVAEEGMDTEQGAMSIITAGHMELVHIVVGIDRIQLKDINMMQRLRTKRTEADTTVTVGVGVRIMIGLK